MSDDKVIGFKPRIVPPAPVQEAKPSAVHANMAKQFLMLADMAARGEITAMAIAVVNINKDGQKGVMTGFDMPEDWPQLIAAVAVLQREVVDHVE